MNTAKAIGRDGGISDTQRNCYMVTCTIYSINTITEEERVELVRLLIQKVRFDRGRNVTSEVAIPENIPAFCDAGMHQRYKVPNITFIAKAAVK